MKVFRCGAMVKSKVGNVEGMITCSAIRFGKVQYEISYFAGLDQKAIWMNEQEFDTQEKKKRIGYK